MESESGNLFGVLRCLSVVLPCEAVEGMSEERQDLCTMCKAQVQNPSAQYFNDLAELILIFHLSNF